MNIPLVSVVIAVHNNEHSIGNCLECLLKQTYKNIEVVVINDYSSDRSSEIIKSYKKEFLNFKIIDNDIQLFQGKSLNKGIIESSGEYIILLDSDYYLDKNSIMEGINYICDTNNDVAVLSGSVFTLQKGYWELLRHVSMLGGKQKKSIKNIKTFSNNIAFIKREIINNFKVIYRPELIRSFDVEFATRVYEKEYNIIYFPQLKAVHDHPMNGWKDYVKHIKKEAEGYFINRTLNPAIHFNFIKNKILFYVLLPFLPFGSTLKKIFNGTEPKIYFYYPLILPILFIGQVYFWFLVSKYLLKNNVR